ncbi:MAG: P-loop NTPase [Treponema sp.]|nr:P-loop NTPase [Treponema sp.]
MVNLLPIASGKGGVGKSSFSVNLAVALAQKGKSVVLADLDFGGANLHTLLGLKNNHIGLGNYIYKQTEDFNSLLQDTQIPNLKFIAGDCLFPGTANMELSAKRRIIKSLNALEADYVIMDLGAGTTYNTLDFFLLTYNSIMVTTPELTSVLNAYSFLKAAAFRFLMRQFKAKSEERLFINNFLKNSSTGTEASFSTLINQIKENYPESGVKILEELEKYRPQIIINMGQVSSDLEMAKKFRKLVFDKLSIKMDFVGFLPRDERVGYSVALRSPLLLTNPTCKFAESVNTSAEKIIQHSYKINELNEYEDDDNNMDLNTLSSEFNK